MNPIPQCRLKTSDILWQRKGLALQRGNPEDFDGSVTGDPCIVWDEEIQAYRMFYFAQRHEGDHEVNCDAHAVSSSGVGDWKKMGPVCFTNPNLLYSGTHKPWVLMDAYRPNYPQKINGVYWLFTVTMRMGHKIIQLAHSNSLAGPWTIQADPILEPGDENAFDGYHTDSVTAFWFEERGEILLFYKGYPQLAQANQPLSPFGSSTAAAVMKPDERQAQKLGQILLPSLVKGHWTSGWTGTIQIFPVVSGGWMGLMNASPTPPAAVGDQPLMREPAPSLGGWVYTSAPFPVTGWQAAENPIEWIENIPEDARYAGEGVNLWRHHGLILPDGRMFLLYNTGSYGQERMFYRCSISPELPSIWIKY